MPTRLFVALCFAAALAACAQPAPQPTPAAGQQVAAATGKPRVLAGANGPGREAYERACAGCHEAGVDGAPMTGRASDWAGRSHLWQAVLVEHAERGYFRMPARGGNPSLDDRQIQMAAEYMLTLTHPKVPVD